MIVGVGIDIVEVARIETSIKRFGDAFTSRLFLPSEIDYCLSQKSPAQFLAARLAAKEAISKAFGTGFGSRLGWKSIEIAHQETGQPIAILHDKGMDLFRAHSASALHVSLSHISAYAIAYAVLESE
jgi:holo-[acyl-carrier protein] synthase